MILFASKLFLFILFIETINSQDREENNSNLVLDVGWNEFYCVGSTEVFNQVGCTVQKNQKQNKIIIYAKNFCSASFMCNKTKFFVNCCYNSRVDDERYSNTPNSVLTHEILIPQRNKISSSLVPQENVHNKQTEVQTKKIIQAVAHSVVDVLSKVDKDCQNGVASNNTLKVFDIDIAKFWGNGFLLLIFIVTCVINTYCCKMMHAQRKIKKETKNITKTLNTLNILNQNLPTCYQSQQNSQPTNPFTVTDQIAILPTPQIQETSRSCFDIESTVAEVHSPKYSIEPTTSDISNIPLQV